MRVLYLNPFSQEVSGPDESLRTLLGGLVALGVEPHVVLPRPGPQVDRYEQLGARVHFAPLTYLKRRLGLLDVLLLLPRLVRGTWAILRLVHRERISLIHTNMEVVLDGALAASLSRRPHVLHYRGNTLDRPRLVFDVLTRFWTLTAQRIFCISGATAEIFRKRGRAARVEVLYNPVRIEAYAAATRLGSVRAELGAGPGDLLVGTVGRIHPRKDVATFLRACAVASRRVPHLRCAVIGAAEAPEELAYLQELKRLASSLRLDVCWAGARRDMPQVLHALDVFVLCSRHEGFGRVVAEAMAAELPMVLTDEGALPELAAHASRVALAPPESAEDFGHHLIEFAMQPERATGDRERAERLFGVAILAGRVWHTYCQLTGTPGSSPLKATKAGGS